MASLLGLPKELRDQIWGHTFDNFYHPERSWPGYIHFDPERPGDVESHRSRLRRHLSFDILWTCRQIQRDLTPLFYHTIAISLSHTNQFLRWLHVIGPRNSSCIRHLSIRFNHLLLEYSSESQLSERQRAWAAALKCMPELLSLTFEFKTAASSEKNDRYALDNDVTLLEELSESASAWSKILLPSFKRGQLPPISLSAQSLHWRTGLRSVQQVVVAIDEPVPPLLEKYFASRLGLRNGDSLELGITGLPMEFFPAQKFSLFSTYVMNNTDDESRRPSTLMTYYKVGTDPASTALTSLKQSLLQTEMQYFRLGCRHIDAAAMMDIPSICYDVYTLDVAFTDSNPNQVAQYLETTRRRCSRLYTFAIDVSPLHNRDPDDDRKESFFKRENVSEDVQKAWQPYWKQLDELAAKGVRVWEGEGPGFRRGKKGQYD